MTDVLLDPQGQQQHSAQPPEVISGVASAAREPAGPGCAGNMDVTNTTAAAAAEPVDAFILFEVLLALLLGTLHGVEDPLGKHFVFVCYLGLSGCVHASVMLGMNLWQRAVGGPNGNAQHLYGDVAGWYAVGIASIIAAAASCRSQRV
ncbi:hypothetical protein OEZ85_004602 [Tetradesmus obliquus]|uniref:Uncharacterized protein n=1 Tax=Tetradesmus obliquus TaxID=3088 RepID=A0ABY8UL76_TETOB|nr:hypothetical protein OEZ85_004602 [Tetradesmus obliquus]